MKLISSYFNKEFIPSILVGLLFYTSLFLIFSFIEIIELSLKNGIPLFKASYIIFLSFPFILTTTIPMSLFFGCILAISKLQSQNEIFAFYSLGISKKIFYKEILRISIIFFLIHCVISFYILPKANRSLVQYRIQLLQSGVSKNVEPRTFIKAFPQKIIYIKNIKKEKKIWENIYVADYSQPDLKQYIFAKEGELFLNPEGSQIWLKIFDTTTLALKDENSFQMNKSKEQNILLFPPINQGKSYKFGAREKNLKELYIDFNNENSYIRNRSKVEFNKRFVLPFLSLIFPFLALAIALRKKEKGSVKGYAFLISLIVIVVSYIFIIYNESLAVDGKMNPYLAMWIIPAFFFLSTILLIIFPEREKKTKVFPFFKTIKIEKIKVKSKKISLNFYLLDFYLLKSFIPYFFIALFSISSLYIIIDFAQLVEDINKNNLSFYSIFLYYLYALPQSLYEYIIPISILSSIAIGCAILERNKEITALRGLGVSLFRIFSSILIFTACVGISIFIFAETYLPLNNQKFEEYKSKIFEKKNLPKTVGYFAQDNFLASEKGWIYKYKAFEKKNMNIIGFEGFNLENIPQIYVEAKELYYNQGSWVALNGIERKIFDGKIDFKKIENEKYEIPDKPEIFSSILDSPANLNIMKLKNYISNLKKAGHKPSRWEVMLYHKLFYPIFIILLGFISIISSFTSRSIYHIWGNLTKALIAGIIYWIAMVFFIKIGEMQMLSPFLSAFSPNFFALILVLYYYIGIKD